MENFHQPPPADNYETQRALEKLLEAPDLNLDELDPVTRELMEQARRVLNNGYGKKK